MVRGSKLYSKSVDEISNESYFPLVLLTFIMLCKVILSFEYTVYSTLLLR